MSAPTERKRRHFSDDQKATVVRRHLADKVPVSDLADCGSNWRLTRRSELSGNRAGSAAAPLATPRTRRSRSSRRASRSKRPS